MLDILLRGINIEYRGILRIIFSCFWGDQDIFLRKIGENWRDFDISSPKNEDLRSEQAGCNAFSRFSPHQN